MLRTVEQCINKYGLAMWPPTPAAWRALSACLKKGTYHSAKNYLSAYKVEAERRGYTIDSWTARAITDYGRSCTRGLGGPIKAAPLPFEALEHLPYHEPPVVAQGPLGPRNFIIMGSWWLTREVELSTAWASLTTISRNSDGAYIAR